MTNLRIKLVRIRSAHQNVRTNEVVGVTEDLPKVGSRFIMFGAPVDPKFDIRMIETSVVTAVDRDTLPVTFRTQFSQYRLEPAN